MLIENLGTQGEDMLTQIIKPGEQIMAKIKGILCEGLVLTDKSIYLLKWGGLIGPFLGVGKGAGTFSYEEILDVIHRKYLFVSTLEFILKGESRISDTKIVLNSVVNFYQRIFGKKTPFEDQIRTRVASFGKTKDEFLNEPLEYIKGNITPVAPSW